MNSKPNETRDEEAEKKFYKNDHKKTSDYGCGCVSGRNKDFSIPE